MINPIKNNGQFDTSDQTVIENKQILKYFKKIYLKVDSDSHLTARGCLSKTMQNFTSNRTTKKGNIKKKIITF